MTLESDVRRIDSGPSEEVVRTPETTLESDETRSVSLPLVSSHLLELGGIVHAVKETLQGHPDPVSKAHTLARYLCPVVKT